MALLRSKPAPRQSTNATQSETVTETMGESSDFTRRALSAAWTDSILAESSRPSSVSCSKRLDGAHGFQALLQDGDDIALALAHLVGSLFYRLLESRDEQQKERRHAHGDEREIPVEVEHHSDHADDGQRIHEDAEQRRGGKTLDRAHIGGDRAQHIADLVSVVILEREAVEVMI